MSNVSRKIYQKVVEENKKLLRDIEILVGPECVGKSALILKWQDRINGQKRTRNLIQAAVLDYMKRNPDDPAVQAVNKFREKVEKVVVRPDKMCKPSQQQNHNKQKEGK